jgi:hypothetical protein
MVLHGWGKIRDQGKDENGYEGQGKEKRSICYLAVAKVVLLLKHDSMSLIIPKSTTKVLELAHPRPLMPPFSQVVVHLSGANNLPTELLKGFGHICGGIAQFSTLSGALAFH